MSVKKYWTVKRAAEACGAPYSAVYSAVKTYGTIEYAQMQDGTQVVTLQAVRDWMQGKREGKGRVPEPEIEKLAGAAHLGRTIGIVQSAVWGNVKRGKIVPVELGCGSKFFDVGQVIADREREREVNSMRIGKNTQVSKVRELIAESGGVFAVEIGQKRYAGELQARKSGVVLYVDTSKPLK